MFRGVMRTLVCSLAALLLAAPAAAQADLADDLTSVMRPAGARSGAYVERLGSQGEVFSWRADTRRIPASVQKLYTTASALKQDGADGTYVTTVTGTGVADAKGVYGGDLFLKGSGDPTLGAPQITDLAQDVAAAGIKRVEGQVLGDESFFDALRGVPDSGLGRISPYVGPVGALLYDRGRAGGGYQSDPPAYAAGRLRDALRTAGVTVRGRAGSAPAPPAAKEIGQAASAPLSALAEQTNKPSDNYVAEMLLKGLGARHGAGGSTKAGAAVVAQTVGELGAQPKVSDGSGLSRANQTTPHDVVDLLQGMASDPAFRPSLAVAGRSGTLSGRMRGTAARGRCQAKTGTLSDVSALAGYCRSRAGGDYVFAVMMNRVSVGAARAQQDRFAALLAAAR